MTTVLCVDCVIAMFSCKLLANEKTRIVTRMNDKEYYSLMGNGRFPVGEVTQSFAAITVVHKI
jgi:hypothetical protein